MFIICLGEPIELFFPPQIQAAPIPSCTNPAQSCLFLEWNTLYSHAGKDYAYTPNDKEEMVANDMDNEVIDDTMVFPSVI